MLEVAAPPTPAPAPARPAQGSEPFFWAKAGAVWRQLAGGLSRDGFSFEWQELEPPVPLNWSHSFHPSSVEICLNLQGTAWVECRSARLDLRPETAAFFVLKGGRLRAQRAAAQRHQFLSLELSLAFLQQRLRTHTRDLHPLVRRSLEDPLPMAGFSDARPLTHRHRDLLRSLLHPPVLASAQRLWYESKALEFAAEFFFSGGEAEPLCTRAQRLAAERVSRTKAALLENLVEPPALEELGRLVGCSQFYLSRTFTQETGLTISQWLRRARLERAAELLRSRKCNVTEAALEVGYSSLSHFSQAFHEMFGCCPGLYPVRTATQRPSEANLASTV